MILPNECLLLNIYFTLPNIATKKQPYQTAHKSFQEFRNTYDIITVRFDLKKSFYHKHTSLFYSLKSFCCCF